MLKWSSKDGILPAEPSTALIAWLFNEGKAPIVFSGPWFLGEVQDSQVRAGAAAVAREAGGKPMRPWLTVEGVYVAAGSKHKEEAYEFASYVSRRRREGARARGRQLPTNKAVYTTRAVGAEPTLRASASRSTRRCRCRTTPR